jgi:EAL domain-containing protein (putative c-di-GMP-specific phosphodiesterase class I)
VLLSGVRSADEAELAARRLLHSLAAPFALDGRDVHVDASIGVALGGGGADAEALLRDADSAMYRAKLLGSGGHVVFDETLRTACRRRMDLETGLYRALSDGELRLAYQPIVETATGRCIGFEALLRWRNAAGEDVSPAEFIPIAEETGTIVPIGAWVLREACKQMRAWRAQYRGLPPRNIAVNVSGRQLLSRDFHDDVLAALEVLGPDTLTLEITESAAAQVTDAAVDVLDRISRLGVRIAIDDFGTGLSSLARLRALPVDIVKIDRQFIAGLDASAEDRSLVLAIVAMTEALGLTAIAEGVETPAQAGALQASGCPLAQGYLFGRPVPAEDIPLPTRPNRGFPRRAGARVTPLVTPPRFTASSA